MKLFNSELLLPNHHLLNSKEFEPTAKMIKVQQEEELFGMDWYNSTCYATEVLDTKYERGEVDEVIFKQLDHLNLEQKENLKKVLKEHTKLFDGTLGIYPHRKFHIDLVPGAIAKHARPYHVPVVHLNAFKKELIHLAEIGVLSLQGASEWVLPTFITPRKDSRVHWVSDLRKSYKVVKKKQYPLPIIWDILQQHKGYTFFIKLDISMQYYTFELDNESKDLCTIATPFGKFKYN